MIDEHYLHRKRETEKEIKKKKKSDTWQLANGVSNQLGGGEEVDPPAPEVEPETDSNWVSRLIARTCISKAAI